MKTAFSKPDGGKGKMLAVVLGILLTLISPMMIGCEPEVKLVVLSGLESSMITLSSALITAVFTGIEMNTVEGTTATGT